MMEDFAKYNSTLENIFHLWKEEPSNPYSNENNITAKEVRSLIGIDTLRESGVFFTGDHLADKAVSRFTKEVNDDSFIIDPTCGSGSLLVAATKKLRIMPTASETLKKWGNQLCGIDIYPEFVYCTKLRIVLESLIRGSVLDEPLEKLVSYLTYIKQGNCLDYKPQMGDATHIIMNPPFNSSENAVNYKWAKGKISNAAVYYYEIANSAKDGCCITAILPDVLRSGSRFENWRTNIAPLGQSEVSNEGRFDTHTDIDIFILSGTVSENSRCEIPWQAKETKFDLSIKDFFDVSVGAVVPYRDPHEGNLYPYIHPKSLPKWGELTSPEEYRHFLGRTYTPPFVAIRRTSGPRDKSRVVPTLILGREPIAVENHLIVLKPKRNGVKQCREVMKMLKQDYVNDFLNTRIRCRHLTVTAVSEIPWRKL